MWYVLRASSTVILKSIISARGLLWNSAAIFSAYPGSYTMSPSENRQMSPSARRMASLRLLPTPLSGKE